MKTSTELLVERLERIARENYKNFRCQINITAINKKILFGFVCREIESGNTFVSGLGETIADSSLDAENTIAEACQQWGYKNVE